jgi:hypothetical protein
MNSDSKSTAMMIKLTTVTKNHLALIPNAQQHNVNISMQLTGSTRCSLDPKIIKRFCVRIKIFEPT